MTIPDPWLLFLIVTAIFGPLLAGPLMLGSFAVTQGQPPALVTRWFLVLAALCAAPAVAVILGLATGRIS